MSRTPYGRRNNEREIQYAAQIHDAVHKTRIHIIFAESAGATVASELGGAEILISAHIRR